jgi:5-methylcytosine-specific restriction protein A
VPSAPRNDVWGWEELVLALDLYSRAKNLSAAEIENECQALSQVLDRMGSQTGAVKTETYRNRNGVRLKLMNFRRLDPELRLLGQVGMQRGAKAEEAVWQKYAGDKAALRADAEKILVTLQLTAAFADDQDKVEEDPYEAEEGGVQMRAHRYYERDRRLIKRKKVEAAKRGPLSCEACGFNFQLRYGPIGDGFIEVHHTKPVHLMQPGEKTRLADLALLCSNCHRVAHRQRPPLEVKEIQNLVTRPTPHG